MMSGSLYLVHHGIKGQRWGVRRYRNEDGSLTAAGKLRYNDDGTRKTHRQKLEEKYRAQGKTNEQAIAAAESRIRGEKIALALGAVAVTVAVAGAIHYRNKYVLDQYIPSDALVKRITVDADPTHLHDRAFYATTKRRDQAKYVGMLGNLRRQQQERFHPDNPLPVNEIAIRVHGAKVASAKSGKNAYLELCATNPQFKRLSKEMGWYGDYTRFNRRGLISDNPKARQMQDIFYQHLHDKGYDGVIDLNDIMGGFKAQAPTIFFGGQVKNGRDIIKSATYRQVPVQEMINADARERGILAVREMAKDVMTDPFIMGSAALGATAGANKWIKEPINEQAKKDAARRRRANAERRKAQNAKIKSLAASSDMTIEEIAKQVGVSTSRVEKILGRS